MSPSVPNDLPATADELAVQAREVARQVGDHLGVHANHLRDTAWSARYHSEEFIRTNPWPAIGAAAAIGFILGTIAARR